MLLRQGLRWEKLLSTDAVETGIEMGKALVY